MHCNTVALYQQISTKGLRTLVRYKRILDFKHDLIIVDETIIIRE